MKINFHYQDENGKDQSKELELIGPSDCPPYESIIGKSGLEYGWEYVNIVQGERRFGWFNEHTSDPEVLKASFKLANVCRVKKPFIE